MLYACVIEPYRNLSQNTTCTYLTSRHGVTIGLCRLGDGNGYGMEVKTSKRFCPPTPIIFSSDYDTGSFVCGCSVLMCGVM